MRIRPRISHSLRHLKSPDFFFDFATGKDRLHRNTRSIAWRVHSSSIQIPVGSVGPPVGRQRRQRQIVYFVARCGIPSSGKNNLRLHPPARGPRPKITEKRKHTRAPGDVWEPDAPPRRSHERSRNENVPVTRR